MQPKIRVDTGQLLLKVEEREQTGVKIQRTKKGFKDVPITRLRTDYMMVDASDAPTINCAAKYEAIVMSRVYYNTSNRTQEVCVAGQFTPVRSWIK